jgi:hypothetical protein
MKLSTKSAERVQVSERDSVGITKLEGTLSASGMRFALVCARFNEFITARLLEGARDGLLRLGASESEIVEVMVPGALEIPQAARALAETNLFDEIRLKKKKYKIKRKRRNQIRKKKRKPRQLTKIKKKDKE